MADRTADDSSTESNNNGPTRWVNKDDPSDTGVDVDPEYLGGGSDDRASESYVDDHAETPFTDGGDPIDADSYAAATDESSDDSDDLDGEPLENSWAAQGVQRTTFYADGTDVNGNALPSTNGLGEDLTARRKRLWGWNSGFKNNDWSDVGQVDMEARHTREMAEAIASQCGLSTFETEHAVNVALAVDGRRWNWAGGRPAMALVGIVRTVADSEEEALESEPVQSEAFEHVATEVCGTAVERLVRKIFEHAD